MSRINKTRHIELHEMCNCKCRLDASVIIKSVGMMINAGVNAKNLLTKVYMIKGLFGILVFVRPNVINRVMFANI